MRSIAVKLPMSGRGKLCLSVWLLSTLAITPVGEGTEPIDPLPAPDYSFDLASWAVAEGHVNARDVLILDLPFPATLLEGEDLGLFDPLDDLDAL
jgi:hypothetical protein